MVSGNAKSARAWNHARVAAWSALLLAGCGPPPAPGPWVEPAPHADGKVAAIRARTAVADRVQASLELTWEDAATEEAGGCSAFLVFDRNEGLRVLARSVAFVTVFELVADSTRVWLDVPREEITVAGPRDDPDWSRLPASPDGFLVALFADPWAGEAEVGAFRHPAGDRDVLQGDDWILRLDPDTGLPARYETDELVIDWGEWALRRGVPWPHLAEIRTAGGTLRARLGRLILGRAGSPGQFLFQASGDRELVSPAEAAERWKSGLEAP